MSVNLSAASLRFKDHQLFLLDQYLLPQQQQWIKITHVEQMVDCIHRLQVRGAPLIGIASALLIAQLAIKGASKTQLISAIESLRAARPTAVNLMFCMDKMLHAVEHSASKEQLLQIAQAIFNEDKQRCLDIAQSGKRSLNLVIIF